MAPNSPDHESLMAPDAFRTISEVAEDLDLPQHVLRFWETRFNQIKPMKRGGGRRYYRPEDIDLLRGIRALLYAEGFTIRGVQRVLKEKGVGFVAGVGRSGSVQPGTADAGEASQPTDWRLDAAGEGDEPPPGEEPSKPELRQALDVRIDPVFAPLSDAEIDPVEEPPLQAPAHPPGPSRPSQGGAGLSHSERRKIEFALADLVEAKRLLDQVR